MITKLTDGITNMIILIVAGMCSIIGMAFMAYLASRREQIIQFLDTMGMVGGGVLLITVAMLPVGLIVGFGSFIYWYNRSRQIDIEFRLVELTQAKMIIEQVKPGHSLITNVSDLQAYHALPSPPPASPPASPPPALTDNLIPNWRDDYWLTDIVASLKSELDDYNQPMTVRVSGNPGTGKTLFVGALLTELIKPFEQADIAVLDRKAHFQRGKWGTLDVLADHIDKYPQSMELLQSELDNRNPDDDPLFVVVDEVDEAHKRYKSDFDDGLNNLLSVGREVGVNPFVVGQSPLAKSSGIDSVTKTYFSLWIILGLEGVEGYLSSPDCKWLKADKDAYKAQLREISHNRFIGLAIPSRVISKPFLFKSPRLGPPQITQTIDRNSSILCLPNERQQSIIDWLNQSPRPSQNKTMVKFYGSK